MTTTEEGSLPRRVRTVLQKSLSQQLARLTEEFISEEIATLRTTESSSTSPSGSHRSDSPVDIVEDSPAALCGTPPYSPEVAEPMDVPEQDERMQDSRDASAQAGAEPACPDQSQGKDVVGSFMTSNPVCLDKNMTLLEAVKVLLKHNISGAPVVEKYEGDTAGCGRLVGVLSEEDLIWKEVEASDKGITEQFREPYLWSLMASDNLMMEAVENQALKVLSNTVGLSMSEMSISVSPDTNMGEAASIMLDAKVKRLPVVAPRPQGKPGMTVVGIITRKDMLRHVMGLLEQEDGRSMQAEAQTPGSA